MMPPLFVLSLKKHKTDCRRFLNFSQKALTAILGSLPRLAALWRAQ
jgi:hypothetical protein